MLIFLSASVEISANQSILFPDHDVGMQSAGSYQELIFKRGTRPGKRSNQDQGYDQSLITNQNQDKIKIWTQIKIKTQIKVWSQIKT